MSGRTRNWCFTSFSDVAPVFDANVMTYLIVGAEVCPTTGKSHWQCFACFKETKTMSAAKKILGECHLEMMMGSHAQASAYCKKAKKFKEFGTCPKQGKRNDLEDVVKLVNEGTDILTIAETCPLQMIKYGKGIIALKAMADQRLAPEWRDLKVIVLWGPSGTGKTRTAVESSDDYYIKDPTNKWFDGYVGQKTLILDEFMPEAAPWATLLRWLDGYKLQVETKGGSTFAMWETVYITSNIPPEKWYKNDFAPLQRRITRIEHLGNLPRSLEPHKPPVPKHSPEVSGNTVQTLHDGFDGFA